jgi:NADPH:quinone reductase-like Zn-dependent oxidoreductase
VVESRGARVQRLAPGDRVMGILGGGGYAEAVVTHERLCLPIPANIDDEHAAALPEAFLTAYDALVLQGRLQAGETVLVPAAASGVGTAALQLARAAGARTVALTRSPDKRARLEQLGLGPVVDGEGPEAVGRIRSAAARGAGSAAGGGGNSPAGGGGNSAARGGVDPAAGGGVDIVLDLVGAAGWPLHLDVLRERGRMILVGTLSGARVDADLSLIMRKRLSVIGTVLRSRPLEEKIAVTQAFARLALPLVAGGALAAVVDRVFDLADAAAAHALMERNATFGKIVLRVA